MYFFSLLCENIIIILQLYRLAEESCSLYQQHGSGDAGANILDKTGKIIEHSAPEYALKLFQHAADVSAVCNNYDNSYKYFDLAFNLTY